MAWKVVHRLAAWMDAVTRLWFLTEDRVSRCIFPPFGPFKLP